MEATAATARHSVMFVFARGYVAGFRYGRAEAIEYPGSRMGVYLRGVAEGDLARRDGVRAVYTADDLSDWPDGGEGAY